MALVDNNIGCVYFQMKKQDEALASFQTAKDILEDCMGSESTRSNLDLLHTAATLCNLGYMKFPLKHYDEWCPARGVVVVVNVRGTRGDHLVLMSSVFRVL